jgi:hypothetical protein
MLFNKKVKIKIYDNELKLIIKSLNYLRNKLIQERTPTEVIDELIYKNIKILKK